MDAWRFQAESDDEDEDEDETEDHEEGDEDAEGRDEDDGLAETVPLTKLQPWHFKTALTEFVNVVLLAKRGHAAHPILTEKNYTAHTKHSILAVFAQFFKMPSDDARRRHKLVKHLMDDVKRKRHHDGECWKPVKPNEGEAGRPGCGCLTGGRSFVKSLGALLDERQLVQLVLSPSRCTAAC